MNLRAQVGVRNVAHILTQVRSSRSGFHELELSYADRRVAWCEFDSCSDGGTPSLDRGQSGNCRWSLNNGEAIHAHWFRDLQVARFHLDRFDPAERPLQHLVEETYVPHGIVGGALAGLALTKHPLGALVGAVAGGFAGAKVDRAPVTTWRLHSFDGYRWEVRVKWQAGAAWDPLLAS